MRPICFGAPKQAKPAAPVVTPIPQAPPQPADPRRVSPDPATAAYQANMAAWEAEQAKLKPATETKLGDITAAPIITGNTDSTYYA